MNGIVAPAGAMWVTVNTPAGVLTRQITQFEDSAADKEIDFRQ
jgi:hypothetical protein